MENYNVIDRKEIGGYAVVLSYDEFSGSFSREWDNLGTIASNLKNYNVGLKDHHLMGYYSSPVEDLKSLIIHERILDYYIDSNGDECLYSNWLDELVVFGFDAYIHSGVALHSPYRILDEDVSTSGYGFDSGFAGFIFATKSKICEWFDCKKITKSILEKVEESFANELKNYNQDIEGEIYSFEVFDKDGDSIDACGSFYDQDDAMECAMETVGYQITKHRENRIKKLKSLIKNNVPIVKRAAILDVVH
jgi:hypothetical protein